MDVASVVKDRRRCIVALRLSSSTAGHGMWRVVRGAEWRWASTELSGDGELE